MKNEFITTSSELSASDISIITSLDDIFNIDRVVDTEKENILYKPIPGEKRGDDLNCGW